MRYDNPGRPLPSLYRNGALNPSAWRPAMSNLRDGAAGILPQQGELVGWRYGAWRCIESEVVAEVDLNDGDRAELDAHVRVVKEEARARVFAAMRPRTIVLKHESGPMILKEGERSQRLHDGSRTIHFRIFPLKHGSSGFPVLEEPYRACSCHGHIWPCQETDQAVMAAHQSRKLDRLMATTQPGICAGCLEMITTRQKSLTFPEESRLVPGAPGPTFHAGRAECWGKAEEYERQHRLAVNEYLPRLASCPGIRFLHESTALGGGDRLECTAGTDCTGHHGPAGYRTDFPCWKKVELIANSGGHARPPRDCGYRGGLGDCVGGDMSSGGSSISPTAADILWQQSHPRPRT